MTLKNAIYGLARWMAYLGGVVLIALIAVTCISIVGRGLNTIGNTPDVIAFSLGIARFLQGFSPVNGDFELMEMGVAFAVFLFLPWCQLTRGHAAVDIFTTRFLNARVNAALLLVWEALFVVVMALITWRLLVGMSDKIRAQETTFLLQWPIWWAYAACAIAGSLGTLVGIYALFDRRRDGAGVSAL